MASDLGLHCLLMTLLHFSGKNGLRWPLSGKFYPPGKNRKSHKLSPFVVLLFIVHGTHLRSCRDGQLTKPHFSWAALDLLSSYPVLHAHTFASNQQLPFLNQVMEKQEYVARPGIEPRSSDLRVRCPTDCTMWPGCLLL